MAYDNRNVSPLKIKGSPYKKNDDKGQQLHNKEGNKKIKLYTEKQIKEMGHNLSDYTVVVTKGGTKYYAKKGKGTSEGKAKFKQLKHPKMPMKD